MQGNLRLYLELYLCCRIVGDRQNKMPEISVFTENQPILGKENGLIRFVERLPPAMRVRRKKFYLCVEKEPPDERE